MMRTFWRPSGIRQLSRQEFPPAVLVELYHEPEAIAARLRRLHLVLLTYATHGRPQPERRSISTSRSLGYGMKEVSALHRYRFAIRKNGDAAMALGYSLDDSDKPIFLIWPERTGNNGFWLLDVARNQYHNLCQATSIRNLGLEHFHAAFGLGCSRNLRTSSARAFGISENNISEACSVPSGIAEAPETTDTWHTLRNSHPEKSQNWP